MKQPLYKAIASKLQAIESCKQSDNSEWLDKHTQSLETLVNDYMPCGSGIDTGTTLNFDISTSNKLVFTFSYHHMSEHGFYTRWTEHKLIVSPSMVYDFDMYITGSNFNDNKDYLYQTFEYALHQEVE